MSQSEYLTNFYKAYYEWLEVGAPEKDTWYDFRRDCGLCTNLYVFLYNADVPYKIRKDVENEMSAQFVQAGLNRTYPFQNGCAIAYERESSSSRIHTNPQRIEWVKNHV